MKFARLYSLRPGKVLGGPSGDSLVPGFKVSIGKVIHVVFGPGETVCGLRKSLDVFEEELDRVLDAEQFGCQLCGNCFKNNKKGHK